MIFTVPEDFEGSFVSNTLKRALSGGMSISIYGNDLYAPDVKMAIRKGILVPVGDGYDKEEAKQGSDAMIVNRTDRVLVLGEIILRPWASLLVNKSVINNAIMQSAEDNGFIHIVSDKKSFASKKFTKTSIKDREQNKKTKEVSEEDFEEEVESVEEDSKPKFVVGAERNVKAKVWNFREQEQEDAAVVPTTPDIINVTEEEHEDIDFVDTDEKEEVEPVRVKAKAAKKKSVKKVSKKTTNKKATKSANKKEVLATKKKKVKALEPVGEKRVPKTQMDAAIELDSRGRPLVEGGADALNHLIDSLMEPEEISFVDDEQAQDRYDSRTDMG